ncbi:MAG: ABC transporter permease subunit [Tetrasphaera sp.]|nr:ABC transporter permease subunit [Actinomycetota bacterium]MCB1301850.1 ABC transporter permease subunit [Tetrasphaera sp.]
MSQPGGIPANPNSASVIHDIGYRPYAGPRHGEGAIARALVTTGFRNAFGLGRSGRSKILPFVLLAFNLAPALAIAGAIMLANLKEMPIGYARYAATTQVLLGIFVAAQAPVLFSRDQRHGTLALYLARPLPAPAYAIARWLALLGATLVFLILPIVILYAVALLGEFDLTDETRKAAVAVGLALLLTAAITGIAGLIASVSTRRGFGVMATIAFLLLGDGIVAAIQGISSQEGNERIGEIAGLFSPYSLYRGLVTAWADGSSMTPPNSTAMEWLYAAVLLAIALACVAGLVWRYRKLATK